MEERSKTNKEIYKQKYPFEEVTQNHMLCSEAIGYLKALNEYFPSEQKWTEKEITALVLRLVIYSLS
jgi:hypothetical protein